MLLALVVLLVIAGGVALLTTSGTAHRAKAPGYDGSAITPPRPRRGFNCATTRANRSTSTATAARRCW